MENKLKIFIDNFGFKNRGDQLMIQSVLNQIRQQRPQANVYVRKEVFLQNPSYCIANTIYPLELSNSGIRHSKLYAMIVNFLLRKEYVVTPRQMDIVLDCCGYYITDAWHKDESDYLYVKHYYSLFCNPNLKIIYLPQAFGPFRNEWSKKIGQLAYLRAIKIYPRDTISMQYLREIVGDDEKLSIAPDFTCFCAPSEQAPIQFPPKQYIIIIPNGNMLEQTASAIASKYLDSLTTIINHLIDRGEYVILLNHEGHDDDEIIASINRKLPQPIPIVTQISGQDIKAIIKYCKLLITARFHGAVSGLTQHVPTLCMSWSHKYAELLKDFSCENNMLDVADKEATIRIIDEALRSPMNYTPTKEKIKENEIRVAKMWDEIFEII